MKIVTHFDMKLHQMIVKTAFLNEDFDDEVYMVQPKGFAANDSSKFIHNLKKSIHGLQQALRQ